MKEKELKFILQEGEGLKIEFKEKFDKSLSKEFVAFANSEGGRIFLGVTDKGKVKEINATNKLKSQIQDLANRCDPSVKINFEKLMKSFNSWDAYLNHANTYNLKKDLVERYFKNVM